MRLLVLNANTTDYVTQTVAAAAQAALDPRDVTLPVTAAFGPAVIHTRLDHAVATHAVVDAAARHAAAVDAVLLAVSFDTGLDALREALHVPVIGMSEATIAMARMVGGRLGYVSLGARATPLYRESLARYCVERDMAAWRTLEAPAAYRAGDKTALDAQLAQAATDLAAEGAEVVVLLGAVLAGAAARIADRAPTPVLDGGRCGALAARAMVALGARKAQVGSFAALRGGAMIGVSPALARLAKGDG